MLSALGLGVLVALICFAFNGRDDMKRRVGWALLWGAVTFVLNVVINYA